MTTGEAAADLQTHALLASALAGRTVAVRPAAPGHPAWTDGVTIYLDPAADTVFQRRCLAVQASLIAAGSLEADILHRVGRRAHTTRRYLAVEGRRALAANEELLPRPVRALLDCVPTGGPSSAHESLQTALSAAKVPAAPPEFGILRPREMAAAPVDSVQSRRHQARKDGAGRAVDEFDPDAEETLGDDEPDVLDQFTSPVGGGATVGKLLQRMMNRVRRLSGGGQPGADAATHRSRSGTAGRAAVLSTTTAPGDAEDVADATGLTYPEWDVHHRRYRPDWCTVEEIDASAGPPETLARPDVHSLRRPLTRLGIGLDRCRRQAQGDDIDIDAAVSARVDMLAGAAGGDVAVYIDNMRRRRDLAVLVLLDISGSAGESGGAGRSVHEQQVRTAHALTVALFELGDRVALYGFRSRGRAAVHVVPVKRFPDTFDAAAVGRLGALKPGAYSRLGAAIRHGAAVIADEAGTSRRLLVVLSDGLAYDHGYERVYGAADARRALAEVRRQGTGCVCLTVGAGTDTAELRRVFGSAAHAAIPRPEELAGVIGPLFRSALRSADLRRRIT